VILRPCAIYGPRDTHNSYGPNRFIRSALRQGKISLFGRGEECRDHIYVGDVAEIVLRCILRKSTGILNAASGQALPFSQVAAIVRASLQQDVVIEELSRNSPITHRQFDITQLISAFPDFQPLPLEIGVPKTVT